MSPQRNTLIACMFWAAALSATPAVSSSLLNGRSPHPGPEAQSMGPAIELIEAARTIEEGALCMASRAVDSILPDSEPTVVGDFIDSQWAKMEPWLDAVTTQPASAIAYAMGDPDGRS